MTFDNGALKFYLNGILVASGTFLMMVLQPDTATPPVSARPIVRGAPTTALLATYLPLMVVLARLPSIPRPSAQPALGRTTGPECKIAYDRDASAERT